MTEQRAQQLTAELNRCTQIVVEQMQPESARRLPRRARLYMNEDVQPWFDRAQDDMRAADSR